jgi:hypothetical protein
MSTARMALPSHDDHLRVLMSYQRPDLLATTELEPRVNLGYAMLFDRMCCGGGWNAGNSIVYGVALAPQMDGRQSVKPGHLRGCVSKMSMLRDPSTHQGR